MQATKAMWKDRTLKDIKLKNVVSGIVVNRTATGKAGLGTVLAMDTPTPSSVTKIELHQEAVCKRSALICFRLLRKFSINDIAL